MAPTHAVVLGGGLAGMLTASVLVRYFDEVTVVERDKLPDGPSPRSGVPQARHAHLLMSGGARAIESLLPGTLDALFAAGAHRIGVPNALVSLSAQGWVPRFPEMQFIVSCSRGLLDWVVRSQTLRDNKISVLTGTEPVSLLGDRQAVTGVLVEDRISREQISLEADLVVDATGRGSRLPAWLVDFGLPAVHSESVDSGLAYATRIFQAPPTAASGFPIVNVQANPRDPFPGCTATLLPIEDGKWLVTLSGTRGGEPSTDESEFVSFARSVRNPVVGELIAAAEPLSPVYGSHSTANRRMFFERLKSWPRGLLALGDSVATYNPVYGHGMSVAAQSAQALDAGLAAGHSAQQVQRGIGKVVDGAWAMATNQDILYPGAVGKPLPLAGRVLQRYVDRLVRTATTEAPVTRAFLDAFTLSAPMANLVRPKMIWATLRGPRSAAPEPTLTAAERDRVTG
ncbi:FAD-dependent oxidoreductase [Lentzea flaviverrucosa]|uniref:Dehydrogenase (Flavoprotein) n=1 Tax=Lentzea flaviverrucosa TaxID=200379 RepID=A0A1H9RS03_9PSEU|nr:FAD-dependent monooxygenase [Lentzea flaviverrucosa]RDI33123.1 flavin-dependent dehydrogenase [Lentzea flaviverrucosa]SER75592.1 Dehydrogenase (flavoprotein) [Lentzea flaviverrucosa]